MKNNFFKSILILTTILIFSSCKKEFDNPPVKQITSGSFINIANIKSKYSLEDVIENEDEEDEELLE